MPWNDNANPGPWGSPPPEKEPGKDSDKKPEAKDAERGPPRRRQPPPPPPGNPPPDLDELLARLRQTFNRLMGGGTGNPLGGEGRGFDRRTVYVVLGAVGALWLFSGVYIVQPRAQAVLMTFGAYTATSGPGLHYRLPWPFQSVRQVEFTRLRTTVIGNVPADDPSSPADSSVEPSDSPTLMLTGDENIVDLSFNVQWRVKNTKDYLFNIDNPDSLLTSVAESAMREVVGRTPLNPIISTGRGQVETQTAALMQDILDRYGAGIIIEAVQINKSGPPLAVAAAFREVASAKQDAQKAANVAQGKAAAQIQDAKGYQAQVVQEAQGEAARFNSVYAQYKLAPGVTRQRLYIETMQKVLAGSTKVIVDGKGTTAPIVLPPSVFQPKPSVQVSGDAQ
jgi:membrane protease subunit HflK